MKEKLLFKHLAGSYLYGTNSESSEIEEEIKEHGKEEESIKEMNILDEMKPKKTPRSITDRLFGDKYMYNIGMHPC